MRRAAPAALTVAALASLAVPTTAPTAAAPQATCESRNRCAVPDPRNDAFQGSTRARRLTDLRAVRWTTPRTDDGLVRVRVAWPRLLDGTRDGRGVRAQELGISMTARDGRFWSVVVDNAEGLEAHKLRSGAEDTVRLPDPDEWSVTVRRSVLEVTFSTEWIPVTRARFGTWAETGIARDEVRRTPPLVIGAD